MDIADLEVKISKELVPYICSVREGETVSEKVNLSLVLGLFASNVITLEKASELAGKSIWDFMDVLRKFNIPWGEYTVDEFRSDQDVLHKIERGFYG